MAQNEQLNPFAAAQEQNAAIFRALSEIAGRSYERALRHSHAVAGDWLEFNIAQLKTGSEVKDATEFYNRGQELARSFQESQKKRYQEWEQIVAEAQSSYGEIMKSSFAANQPQETVARSKTASRKS